MPGSLGLIAVVLAAIAVALAGDDAFAAHVSCGDTITQDTTLDSDLVDCPGDGILIGAGGITLDLKGHTVAGDGDARRCDTGIVNGRFDHCRGYQVGHDGVTIRGGTVRDFAHGVQVVEARDNALLHLRLYGNTGFGGIATALMSNGRIEDNQAFNNRTGIAVYEPTGRTTIAGNVLGRNTSFGIELAGSAPGDRFEENVAFENGTGFFFFTTTGLLIRGNRSFGNHAVGMALVVGSFGNHLEGNRLWGNGSAGIRLDVTADDNRVARNTVYRNASTVAASDHYAGGIVVGEGSDNEIVGNRVSENGGPGGIVIEAGSYGNAVIANHVSRNLGHGISLAAPRYQDEGGMTISDNRSLRNGQDGIHVSQDHPDAGAQIQISTISRNRTDRNGDDGIDLESPKALLSANRARWNADLGIEALAGVMDGLGNRAHANGNLLQCINVLCK